MIIIVAAVARNGVIGKDNLIPWRQRQDLIHLKNLTAGQAVILGRKSYESMLAYYDERGRTRPGSLYVVITRDAGYAVTSEKSATASSVDEALQQVQVAGYTDAYVIGGQQVFELFMPRADKLIITEIAADVAGDTYFPAYKDGWREVSREPHVHDEKNDYDYAFVTYRRNI